MNPIPPTAVAPFQVPTRDAALLDAAKKLEATFLAEMLKAAGFGQACESLGGGEGEDQFASFLVQEQATAMVEASGIGLAENLFRSLKEHADNGREYTRHSRFIKRFVG